MDSETLPKQIVDDVQTSKVKKSRKSTKEKITAVVESSKKYNLRIKSSSENRNEIQHRNKNELRNPLQQTKQRPAPLSKYRRKTANLRERCRMQEINDAFKRLQSVVPDIFSITEDKSSHSMAKLTKINTLKLAVNYISALTQILKQSEDNNNASLINYSRNENDKPSEGGSRQKSGLIRNDDTSAIMNVRNLTNCDQFHFGNGSNQILTNQNEQVFFNTNNYDDGKNNQKYSFKNEFNFRDLVSNSNMDEKYKTIQTTSSVESDIWKRAGDIEDTLDNIETIFEDLDSLFDFVS